MDSCVSFFIGKNENGGNKKRKKNGRAKKKKDKKSSGFCQTKTIEKKGEKDMNKGGDFFVTMFKLNPVFVGGVHLECLSANEMAISIIEWVLKNGTKEEKDQLGWHNLSYNPAAIHLIEKT